MYARLSWDRERAGIFAWVVGDDMKEREETKKSVNIPVSFFRMIGRWTIRAVGNFGAMAVFFFLGFINIFRARADS
jgi:hypothetical protein